MIKIRDRCKLFVEYCKLNQPKGEFLTYRTPFELLVAVVLSAQCTDKRINTITPALFSTFPTPYHLCKASVDQVFSYIRSVSYPMAKAKYLIALAQRLVDNFNGKVPDNASALQSLAGVGRKSANVVLAKLYNQPLIAVDTHVFRVTKRMGLVSSRASTPLKVERELEAYIPKESRAKISRWLISHGRKRCRAVRPKCHECPFTSWCRYYTTQKITPNR